MKFKSGYVEFKDGHKEDILTIAEGEEHITMWTMDNCYEYQPKFKRFRVKDQMDPKRWLPCRMASKFTILYERGGLTAKLNENKRKSRKS